MAQPMTDQLPIDDDSAWAPIAARWQIRSGTIYLNHGSYGPPPDAVRLARRQWIDRLDEDPVDFFNRHFERELFAARDRLAKFVGTSGENLIFVENATAGMNVVASSFRLAAGDEVLATDHEYGAVLRIWDRACREAGAILKIVELPLLFTSADETTAAIFAAANKRTRLLIASHITSTTAVTLPIDRICMEARRRGIATAIDGPHALAQLPLAIDSLGCDFYAASCHKWLSASLGSGFLYVGPLFQQFSRPPELSWGRIQPTPVERWSDEFVWTGTRDPSANLTVPTAIDFLEKIGLEEFRARTHWLAQYACRRLVELTGLEPIVPDDEAWYSAMAHVPLPPRRKSPAEDAAERAKLPHSVVNLLQHALWRDFGIEVPIVEFRGRRYIRVSCHLYNDVRQIDRLVEGLGQLLAAGE
jgi:isopenicillin-N epimerase